MILRQINYIGNMKIKPNIQMFEVDPQLKFVCINVPQHYMIYLIDLNEFTFQLQASIMNYADKLIYSSKLAVNAIAKIDTSKNIAKSGVIMLKVAPIFNKRQFLAYGTIQHIHIYEILNKNNKLTVKPHQLILVEHQSPVTVMRFHYSALYLGHFNNEMRIFELDSQKNYWYESNSLIKNDDQFIRILMCEDDGWQTQKDHWDMHTRNIVQKQHNNDVDYESQDQELKQKHYKFQRMLSIEQLMAQKNLQYQQQDTHSQSEIEPKAPLIIYQRNDNSLWLAQFDYEIEDYRHYELCYPIQYNFKPIIRENDGIEGEQESFNQEKQQNLMGIKSQMKKKTPGKLANKDNKTPAKSVKKINQSTLKKLSNKKTSLKKLSSQHEKQFEDFIQQQGQQIILSDPMMYKLSMCGNYIIQDTQSTYRIFSHLAHWKLIYQDVRQPCVNPFFEKINKNVLLNFSYLMGQDLKNCIMNFLNDNYEFVIVVFPTFIPPEKSNQNETQILKLELLIIDKFGALQSINEKNIRQQISQGKKLLSQIIKMENEINQLYDEEMVQEIINETKKLTLKDTTKSNKKVPTHKKRTSVKKKVTNQKSKSTKKNLLQQKLQQQETYGGYNLRIRSPKQKSPYIEKECQSPQKKNKISNKGKFVQEQNQRNQQSVYQQVKPQTDAIDNGPNVYSMPILQFDYLKCQPLKMQWISQHELIFADSFKRLNYFNFSPNFIYRALGKVYLYLYWVEFRDQLNFSMISKFKRIISQFQEMHEEAIKYQNQRQYENQDNQDIEI